MRNISKIIIVLFNLNIHKNGTNTYFCTCVYGVHNPFDIFLQRKYALPQIYELCLLILKSTHVTMTIHHTTIAITKLMLIF